MYYDYDALRKRAGIIEEENRSTVAHVADNYINGNISDVLYTVRTARSVLLAQVALYLNEYAGQDEMISFLKAVARAQR